ncbi:bile acid:sodium symporter family protein [Streptomyces aidingensis]|uniref:Solute carrier family 10 (Sodium/bile acid cotransporter), member 7 n=1 Tax=Streptomyces aidingensis TaxID=910347 RepID=A0A1I1J306_9ACTN|nr:bile acid:sodium symporter family protein [Streptomyces aidingensis]SFC42856.1 solute carrier family 10 (sodium/bile acid cotransporter), member 7 [Streptomyces aidingensis]
MRRFVRLIDPYLVLLLATVGLAAALPARSTAADAVDATATGAIALLFFLYGARLSTAEALAGLRHWRLHLTILGCTFLLYPLLGLACRGLVPWLVTEELYTGLLFLCVVPSTVQSAIALTSVARGNVAAAIAAGSSSSLAGVVLTPLLAALLIGASGGFGGESLLKIALQLLLPFLAGQVLRRWIGGFVVRHRAVLGLVDRGSILIVVYAAFSQGMNEDIWGRVSWQRLLALAAVAAVLLAVVLLLTGYGTRKLGFARADRTAILFAGSTKSLAAGLPMAGVIFGERAALAVLPLMLFHQMQLITGAVLARRLGGPAQAEAADEDGAEDADGAADGAAAGAAAEDDGSSSR